MNCENENATVSGETYEKNYEGIAHGINEYLTPPIANAATCPSIGHQSKLKNNDKANLGDEVDAGKKTNKSKTNAVPFDNQHNLRLAHSKKYEDLVNRSLQRLRRESGSYNKGIKKISAFQKQAIKSNSIKFQNEGGMIKKITITNNKSAQSTSENCLNLNPTIIKVKKPMTLASTDDKLLKQQRSYTFSREYIALQRSVSESKVLTEFVTDASVVKSRKLRKKQPVVAQDIMATTPTSSDHSYSSTDLANKKRQRNKRLMPGGDEHLLNNSSISVSTVTDTGLGGRSHSPSMYNNYSDNSNSNSEHKKRCKSLQKYDSDSSLHSTLNKWPSEEILNSELGNVKRTNMRSENSDFVQRQKEFLQQVKISTQNSPTPRRSRSPSLGQDSLDYGIKPARPKERTSKRLQAEFEVAEENDHLLSSTTKETRNSVTANTSGNSVGAANTSVEVDNNDINCYEMLLKKDFPPPPRIGCDQFCWKCHACKVNISCVRCLRSYHAVCAKAKLDDMANIWVCPDCHALDSTLNNSKRSRYHDLSVDLLSQLLAFALKRIRFAKGHYSFRMPYEEHVSLKRLIVYPVTFSSLHEKVEAKEYRSVDEFVNDMKWMLHNAHILACGGSTKIITDTKVILKICRQEANEIETCAECYLNANTRSDWFVDVCSQPHLLLWAKLKGFPYWPAKAMGLGPPALVKVKFFGEHDRAFVPIKDCYLYSTQDPNTQTGKRAARELADCIKEVGQHIDRIIAKVGGFSYAPFKTPYDPNDEMRQLENMMPGVQEFMKRQQGAVTKPSLQFKIYKTADNNMSIIQKDLSTGEISSGQSQENDDIVGNGAQKKKKGFTPPPLVGVQEKNGEAVISKPPPKYEVVLKVSLDDVNSSKLSPVILKRKSNNGGDGKRALEEEVNGQHCMPKLTRMEAKTQELNASNPSLKRKIDSPSLEKTKSKHSKPQEMKIPIVSIKRLTALKDDNAPDTNKNFEVRPNSNPNLQIDKSAPSQTAVEKSLLGSKQSLTLKKISQNQAAPSSSPPALSAGTVTLVSSVFVVPPPVQALQTAGEASVAHTLKDNVANPTTQPLHAEPNASKPTTDKTDDKNKRDVVKNIWKDLKPFVEIKKEVLSDSEQVEEKEQPQKNETALTNKPQDPEVSCNLNIANVVPNEKLIPKSVSSNEISNENLLTHVKKEIVSDEDNEFDDNAPLLPELSQIKSGQANNIINNNNKGPADVRVVGETIIQKVTPKSNVSQQVNAPSNQTHKRNTLKGIPYGPLPASALMKTKPQIDTSAVNTRAKKSFPVLPSPAEGLAVKTTLNVPDSMATSGAIISPIVATNRRPLSRSTTMVAIPVDYGANPNQNTSGITTMVSSIPVPPLMAVSKMISPVNAINSMATTNTSTMTMSGLTGFLPSSTVVAYNALTTVTAASVATSMITSSSPSFSQPSSSFTIAARKSPLTSALVTTTCLSSTTVALTARKSPITTISFNNRSNLSAGAGTMITQNPKPIIMSTPPPLAGLSGTVFNNPIIPNVTTATETTFTPPILTTSINAAGTIKRGPPKLVSRPRGPLQSEGQPTCSSQAGPVSKVFIENAHKITDYFISVMEDTMNEIAQGNEASLQARVVLLEKELERTKQTSEQQMAELRRTCELMRMNMENEKNRLLIETRKQCEAERIRAIEETKRKQWCAQCRQEANFYCCWNASYCGYTCQQMHWGKHTANCAQTCPTSVDMASSSNTTVASSTSIMPERLQVNTTNSISILSSTVTSNNKSNISSLPTTHSKKEKSLAKHASSSNMSSSHLSAASSTLSAATHSNKSLSTEVLQLPTNTYMTPVTRGAPPVSAQTFRCNTTNSLPVQRFVSVPTTTHVSASGGPHAISTVRQSNGWARAIHIPTNTPRNVTVAAPIANVPTADRSGNVKTQIRYI